MTDYGENFEYPVNHDYGDGVYRRRIRLTGYKNRVYGEMEDTNHGFCVMVHHDGQAVTGFEPEFRRTPFNMCTSAGKALDNLLGASVELAGKELNLQAIPSDNCTHLLDLTVLAIRHATQGETVTVWDIAVTDESDNPIELTVKKDGQLIHHWTARDWQIVEPEVFAGKPLFRGFALWASQAFTDLELEAAFILQKGHFVANARRYDVNKMAGYPATIDKTMQGACHTYSPGQIEKAFRTENSMRDFSDAEEQLLKFV